MEFFLIYLFVMVEKIAAMFAAGWFLVWVPFALLILIFFMMGICDASEEEFGKAWTNFKKWYFRLLLPIGLFMGAIGHLMPNQEQLAIIVGSGVTYHVLTSEPAQRIGGKALQLLEDKIEKALENSKVEKEEGNKEEIEKSSGKEHAQST